MHVSDEFLHVVEWELSSVKPSYIHPTAQCTISWCRNLFSFFPVEKMEPLKLLWRNIALSSTSSTINAFWTQNNAWFFFYLRYVQTIPVHVPAAPRYWHIKLLSMQSYLWRRWWNQTVMGCRQRGCLLATDVMQCKVAHAHQICRAVT